MDSNTSKKLSNDLTNSNEKNMENKNIIEMSDDEFIGQNKLLVKKMIDTKYIYQPDILIILSMKNDFNIV